MLEIWLELRSVGVFESDSVGASEKCWRMWESAGVLESIAVLEFV